MGVYPYCKKNPVDNLCVSWEVLVGLFIVLKVELKSVQDGAFKPLGQVVYQSATFGEKG